MSEPTTVTLGGGGVAHYWRAGGGRPVLYLHSHVAPVGEGEFFRLLAERFEVVMPLAPGFADLDELAGFEAISDLVLFYDDLLRHLGLDVVAVVGHGFGGMIAAELAAHFPERVGRLALVSPFGLWDDDDPVADLARVLPPDPYKPGPDDGDGAAADARVVAFSVGMTAANRWLWPFPDQGLSKRLHRVQARTCIYWGVDDEVNPHSYAGRFAAAIRGASVEQIAGRHLLVEEQPDEMAKRIGEFLLGN